MGAPISDSRGQEGQLAVPRSRAGVRPCLRKRAAALVGAIAALAAPALAWAQGCPLCYTAAAAAKAGGIQALRTGILILMIPPMLIFGALSVVAIRRRNLFYEDPETDLGAGIAALEDAQEGALECAEDGPADEAVTLLSGSHDSG